MGFHKNNLKSLRCILSKDKLDILSNNLSNQIKTIHNSNLYSKITNREKKQTARFYCTSSNSALIGNLPPFFITGLTDAECSFT